MGMKSARDHRAAVHVRVPYTERVNGGRKRASIAIRRYLPRRNHAGWLCGKKILLALQRFLIR